MKKIKDARLLGISGFARTGKDKLASFISSKLAEKNSKSFIVPFAGELKKEVDDLLTRTLGISAFTEDSEEKKIIRPFLTFWGTEIRRKLNSNVWIEKVENKCRNFVDNVLHIIPDVRFMNEAEWIQKNNGILIALKRPEIGPANEDEKREIPPIQERADIILDIPWQEREEDFLEKLNGKLLFD